MEAMASPNIDKTKKSHVNLMRAWTTGPSGCWTGKNEFSTLIVAYTTVRPSATLVKNAQKKATSSVLINVKTSVDTW